MEEQHSGKVGRQAAIEQVVDAAPDLAAEPVPVKITRLTEIRDHFTRTDGEHQVVPAEGQHDHHQRLHQPGIAQRVVEIIPPGQMLHLEKGDHDVAEYDAKDGVGQQAREVGPVVHELPPEGGTSDLDIETQHHFLSCLLQHKNPDTQPVWGVPVLPPAFADTHNCGIVSDYPV